MTGDYQDHTCMARDAVADARREAAAASARLAEAAVRYADCRIAEMLAAAARNLGADDPRTEQQRRSDLFADLLLGRLAFDDQGSDETDEFPHADEAGQAEDCEWLEVENIDPDTGELLGTQLQPVNSDGEPFGEPIDSTSRPSQPSPAAPQFIKRRRIIRIGVVVPLSSLLGAADCPCELADRSGVIPGDTLKDLIAESLDADSSTEVLFTRLLTDDGGRLLDSTELGRYPSTRLAEVIKIRAGTCRFPTCTVPADRCDLDHHDPHPYGPTSGANMDPFCRRHHRGKTFAWQAAFRDDHGVDWTMSTADRYRCIDEPPPTGCAA